MIRQYIYLCDEDGSTLPDGPERRGLPHWIVPVQLRPCVGSYEEWLESVGPAYRQKRYDRIRFAVPALLTYEELSQLARDGWNRGLIRGGVVQATVTGEGHPPASPDPVTVTAQQERAA